MAKQFRLIKLYCPSDVNILVNICMKVLVLMCWPHYKAIPAFEIMLSVFLSVCLTSKFVLTFAFGINIVDRIAKQFRLMECCYPSFRACLSVCLSVNILVKLGIEVLEIALQSSHTVFSLFLSM